MTTQAKVVLSAEDRTSAAFASVMRNADKLGFSFDTLKAGAIGALSALAVPVSVAGIATVFNESRRAIDGLNDLADASGSSVEAISALDNIARSTGGNLETVSSILVKFNGVLADADPNKGVGATLKAIGLSVEELKRLDPAEALRVTAVAVEKLGSETDKARVYQELFGKATRDAAPFLKDLAEAKRLDAALTAEQVEQMDRFNKEMAKLNATATNVGRSLSIGLATEINGIIKKFEDAEKAGKSFLSAIFLSPAEMERKNRAAGVFGMTPLQELQRAQEQIRTLERAPLSLGETDREKDPRMIDARARVARLTPVVQAAGGGRGFVSPPKVSELPPDRPRLPDPDPNPKPNPKAGLSAAQKAAQDYDAFQRETEEARAKYLERRWDEQERERVESAKRAQEDYDDFQRKAEEDRIRYLEKRWEEQERDRLDAAKKAADEQAKQVERLGDAFSSTFDSAFREGMKVGDLIKKLAFDAINIQFLTPATQKLGSTLGSAVSSLFSFDGGGYTGSGSRSGGIDGKGGFLSVLHPNETVLDHTRGQGMGGGATAVIQQTFNFGNASADTVAQLRAEAARIKAETLAAVPAAVLQARRTSTGFANALRGA